MKELTIGALARAASLGVETIRFYERRGLLRRLPMRDLACRKIAEIEPKITALAVMKVALAS